MFFLFSCETKVDLDINEGPKNIVIDGGITDKAGHDTIFLSLTQDYNSTDEFTYVGGATLVITENETLIDTLQEVEKGVYVTQKIEKGVIGNSYKLYLKTPEGVEYQSTVETIQKGISIDSLYFRKSDELSFEPFLEEGYYGLLAFIDPPEDQNFLSFRYTINGEKQNTPSDIDLYDDKYVNGEKIPEWLVNYPLEVGDKLQIEQIAITELRHQYLVNLQQLLTSNGGPFDPPIPPVIGNIFKIGSTTEYALGYFQATSSTFIEGTVVQR